VVRRTARGVDSIPAVAWIATTIPLLALLACGSRAGGRAEDGSVVGDAYSTDDAAADAADDVIGPADAGCELPEASTSRTARLKTVAATVQSWVSGQTDLLTDDAGAINCDASAASGYSVQEFAQYAIGAIWLALQDADAGVTTALNRAEAMARCTFEYQQYTPGSSDPSNGLFAFNPGGAYNISDNGTEFAVWGLATLLGAYAPLLPQSFISFAVPRLEAALDAIEGHAVCPAYTNICLMQIADLVVAGQWLAQLTDAGESAAGAGYVTAGTTLLEQWSQFTQANGVAEYDSPTYGSIDLKVLETAYSFGPPSMQGSFRRALDYLWTYVAASTLPTRGNLAPPFGRTYDFYYGQGLLQGDLYIEGLTPPALTPGPPPTLVFNLVNASFAGYRPPASTLCSSGDPVREVRSTWGQDASTTGKERYLYITPDFTLGSTSAGYNPTNIASVQDLPVAGTLGASYGVPLLTVFGDYFDNPGGESITQGGFTKVTHLQTLPAAAQLRGDLLVALRIDAQDPGYTDATGNPVPLVNLATDVLVPAGADDLLIDGHPADLTKVTTLDSNATVTVRVGTGVLSVALVDASGLECPVPGSAIAERSTPTVQFKSFMPSSAHSGAIARLVVYHDMNLPSNTSSLQGCWARTTLLIRGTSLSGVSPSADAAAFALQTRAAALAAKVQYDAGTGSYGVLLRAAVDAGPQLYVQRTLSPNIVESRLVNGQAISFLPLEVGGRAVSF
jgi:hypothetical protein